MSQWEYCVITGISFGAGFSTHYPHLICFTPDEDGWATTYFDKPRGESEVDRTARTIAKLGEEGWEMVGVACDDRGRQTVYFKRLKPE